MRKKLIEIPFIGLASDLGGNIVGSGEGPRFLKKIFDLPSFQEIIPHSKERNCCSVIAQANTNLAESTQKLAKAGQFFIHFGGDHSCAIGTWSGVAEGYREKGDIGLLWIDAHMDSHTPATSKSGNIHGMPLAALLGYGHPELTNVLSSRPKLKPENIALIGIRSYEEEEASFLEQLGVHVYFMQDIKQHGLEKILRLALEHVTQSTIGYGISFDLDSLDPIFANAVGTPVPDGLDLEELLKCFFLFQHQLPLAFELVEYNPSLDQQFVSLTAIRKILNEVVFLSR